MTFQDEDENMDKVVEGRDFHAWRNLMEVVMPLHAGVGYNGIDNDTSEASHEMSYIYIAQ